MKHHPEVRPSTVHAARWLVSASSRALGTILICVGAYLIIKRVAFAIGTRQGTDMLTAWEGIGEQHSLYRGLAMLIVGLPLLFLAQRLARFIVRVPDSGCPRCHYDRSDNTERCPECGYRFHD